MTLGESVSTVITIKLLRVHISLCSFYIFNFLDIFLNDVFNDSGAGAMENSKYFNNFPDMLILISSIAYFNWIWSENVK